MSRDDVMSWSLATLVEQWLHGSDGVASRQEMHFLTISTKARYSDLQLECSFQPLLEPLGYRAWIVQR